MLDLLNAYRVDAQHIASVILALAIWRWGAAPERWMIAVFVGTMVVPPRVLPLLNDGLPVLDAYSTVYVGIDMLAAAAFVALALQANRNYPLWIAGFQVVAIGAHAVSVLGVPVSPLAYLVMAVGPSYCQLVLILAGFVRHLVRENQFGPYRSWRSAVRSMGG